MDWTFLTLQIINVHVLVEIANVVLNYKLKEKHFQLKRRLQMHIMFRILLLIPKKHVLKQITGQKTSKYTEHWLETS